VEVSHSRTVGRRQGRKQRADGRAVSRGELICQGKTAQKTGQSGVKGNGERRIVGWAVQRACQGRGNDQCRRQ
jgi:hypothetical protein